MKKNICVLIMPTDQCNMNCIYCYHNPHYNSNKGIMNLNTLENIFKKTIPYFEHVDFLWHGGEPLLAGIGFYKKAIELQKKYAKSTCVVTNKVQTNCTIAKGDLLEFLVGEGFEFGTSLDGTTNEESRGNTTLILQGINNIKNLNKKCNCILVVSSLNVNLLIESYNFFKDNQISFKFNSYIDTTHDETSRRLAVSINDYLNAQKALFDYWIFDTECNIRVTTFFVYIEYIFFKRKLLGKYNSCLGKWLGVRFNGDIVQCNRYNHSYYGNINDVDKLTDAFSSEGFRNVLEKTIKRRELCQSACELYDFCQGGCIVEASHELGIEKINNFSCIETKEMYKYIDLRINEILNNYKKYRDHINPTVKNCIEQYLEKCI